MVLAGEHPVVDMDKHQAAVENSLVRWDLEGTGKQQVDIPIWAPPLTKEK